MKRNDCPKRLESCVGCEYNKNELLAAIVGEEINQILDKYDVHELYLTGYDKDVKRFGIFIYGSSIQVEQYLKRAKERVLEGTDRN